MYKTILALFIGVILGACQKFDDFRENDPTYKNEAFFIKNSLLPSQLNNINLSPPRQIIEVGDVFIDDKFIYVGDNFKGVQIYTDIESASPRPLVYIEIPTMRNFFVKDGNLIANSGNDLIAYRIGGIGVLNDNGGNIDAVVNNPNLFGVINRKPNLFEYPNYPKERGVYFECPDSLGFVTEWEKRAVSNTLNCYR